MNDTATPNVPADPGPPTCRPHEDGVTFPQHQGRRPTIQTGRAIVADAARVADVELAKRIETADRWHSYYIAMIRELMTASHASSEAALAVARAGIASMRGRIVFNRSGDDVALVDALTTPPPAIPRAPPVISAVLPANEC